MVLARDGKVYTFGCGLFGKLGHGFGQCEFTPRYLPVCIKNMVVVVDDPRNCSRLVSTLQGQQIVKIAAGPQHSVVLNSQGKARRFRLLLLLLFHLLGNY
jgi:alpha-tubulin suppressor-like RCC1 family protein